MDRQRLILGAWASYAAIVTLRHLLNPAEHGLPPPSAYLASGVLYSLFYLSAPLLGSLPVALAIGVPIAVLVNPYLKGSDTSPIQQLAGFVDMISGQSPPAGQSSSPPAGNLPSSGSFPRPA